jgi:hypothetical protein
MYRHGLKRGSYPAWCYESVGQVFRRHITVLFLILMTISHSTLALDNIASPSAAPTQSLSDSATNNSTLLECLQVAAPVLSPDDGCQRTLMVHTFAFSYGQPFVGKSNMHLMGTLVDFYSPSLHTWYYLAHMLINSDRQLRPASL